MFLPNRFLSLLSETSAPEDTFNSPHSPYAHHSLVLYVPNKVEAHKQPTQRQQQLFSSDTALSTHRFQVLSRKERAQGLFPSKPLNEDGSFSFLSCLPHFPQFPHQAPPPRSHTVVSCLQQKRNTEKFHSTVQPAKTAPGFRQKKVMINKSNKRGSLKTNDESKKRRISRCSVKTARCVLLLDVRQPSPSLFPPMLPTLLRSFRSKRPFDVAASPPHSPPSFSLLSSRLVHTLLPYPADDTSPLARTARNISSSFSPLQAFPLKLA